MSEKDKNKIRIIDFSITFQDSKKNRKTLTDPKYIENIVIKEDTQNIYQAKPLEEIEQNQKIVNKLIEFNSYMDKNCQNESSTEHKGWHYITKLIHDATGKNIKDL